MAAWTDSGFVISVLECHLVAFEVTPVLGDPPRAVIPSDWMGESLLWVTFAIWLEGTRLGDARAVATFEMLSAILELVLEPVLVLVLVLVLALVLALVRFLVRGTQWVPRLEPSWEPRLEPRLDPQQVLVERLGAMVRVRAQ